ncbi:DUF1284 domain-containing protein [Clostridium estertheticum]|nr:DUF1284 domain-containing protein [Clostridium estertheticum]WAG43551.1 DUF1284 domain-containing protein [Clostridium estertheticum]
MCVACPHNFKNGFCESDEKVFVFDSKVLNELKLIEGRTYLYKDILNNIRENLTYEKFLKICKSCYWCYFYCYICPIHLNLVIEVHIKRYPLLFRYFSLSA